MGKKEQEGQITSLDRGTSSVLKASRLGTGARTKPPLAEDPGDGEGLYTGPGALVPPYDPNTLIRLYESSNALRQNIDAYITNIESFGYRFEPTVNIASDDIREVIETSVVEDQRLSGKSLPERPSDEDVTIRIQLLETQMRTERMRLDFFFEYCCPEMSFTRLRKITRQDLEIMGNAFWEVIRDANGEVAQLSYLPAQTVRLMPADKCLCLAEQTIQPTPITKKKRQYFRRHRRYVQATDFTSSRDYYATNTAHYTYFKDFGDNRVLSSKTGKYYDTREELAREEGITVRPANEAIHFKVHSPTGPYGIPRWAGVMQSVLGSNQAEKVNLIYFENKSVPPLAIMVSGGRVSEETISRIEDFMENDIKGSDNFHNVLLLEAEGPLTQGGTEHTGRMKIDIRPLTDSMHKDALFQKYDERNMQKVGMAFRIPPLLRGDSRDFNRATAQAVLKFTENQVFYPERQEFDDIINRTLLPSFEICYYKFISNSPKATNPEDQAKVMEVLTRSGGIIPEEARELASEILNKPLRKIKQPWVKVPFPLSVSGRVDEMLLLGSVLDRLETMMADGVLTSDETDELEDIGSEFVEELDTDGSGEVEPEESEAPTPEQTDKDYLTSGKLVPRNMNEFQRLLPKITSNKSYNSLHHIFERIERLDNLTKKSFEEKRDEVFSKYKATVNMSASELERWADNPCAKLASLDRSPITRNLRLLRKNKDQWTAADVRDANRTISFVSRMRGMPMGKPVRVPSEEYPRGCPSKRDISLLNWAYDPRKTRKANESAKTPAEPDERRRGSSVNPSGSAASASSGSSIKITAAVETSLKNKTKEHNEEHGSTSGKKVTLGMLKSVWRRGAGAFSTSHRPSQNRQSWAMARVNAFLHLVSTGSPKNSKYVTDNDLLPSGHPRKSKK
jgi:PBSX family phage portal protein